MPAIPWMASMEAICAQGRSNEIGANIPMEGGRKVGVTVAESGKELSPYH